jgi:dihydroorotate dehydrogenase electron transfer subunit
MNTLSTDPNAARGGATTEESTRVIALCADHVSVDIGQPCAIAGTIAENQCEVRSNAWVNAEYKHLVLTAPELALTARAGQFFHLACPASNDDSPYLRRPMSIYCVAAEDSRIEFLYKVQGAGTRGLAQLRPGDTLDALGPLGNGFALPASAEPAHVLLLGRGVGLATMAPLAQQAILAGARVTAILSARSRALTMSADYLEAAGANVITVTDDEQTSDVVQVESLIRRVHGQLPITYAATCGSNRLLVMLQRVASQLNIPGQVALEQRMGCGYGACYACVRPFRKQAGSEELSYRRVCWEGPVFDLQETTSW